MYRVRKWCLSCDHDPTVGVGRPSSVGRGKTNMTRSPPLVRTWHLIPSSALEHPASSFLANSTPLLKEKRHSVRNAAIANRGDPPWFHRASARTGFTPDDHPMDSV